MSAPVPDAASEGGNTGSAGATSLSWNHTVGASLANSAIVATGQVSNGSGSDISNVQWDAAVTPIAFTKFGSIIDSAGFAHAAQWLLKSPASGTKQVKITAAASAQISGGAASFSNVDQTTPWNPAGPQTNTGSTSPQPSLVVTSGVNELAIASVADDENTTNDALTVSASSGTATTINNDSVGVGLLSGRGDYAPGASSVTFTYAGAHAGDTTWAVIGGSLRGATSAVSAPLMMPAMRPLPNGLRGTIAMVIRAQRMVVTTPSVGGTAFTVSLDGAVTSAGTLTNFTTAPKTGTLPSGGVLAKLTQATKTGAAASSGALAKQAQLPKAGTVASSGALALVRLAKLALAGTVASAGTLAKQTAKSLAGSVASAGALAKAVLKILAGAVASAGALVKLARKTLAGSMSSSGALSVIRAILITLGGTMGSSGALVRQSGKALAGSVSASGSIAKRAARALAGSVTPTGALRKSIARATGGVLGSIGSLIAAIAQLFKPVPSPTRGSAGSVATAARATSVATIAVSQSVVRSATAKAVHTNATPLDSQGIPMDVNVITFTQYETGPVTIKITDADGVAVDLSGLTVPKINVAAPNGTLIVDHAVATGLTAQGAFVWNRQAAEVAKPGTYKLQLEGLQGANRVELPTGGILVTILPALAPPAP